MLLPARFLRAARRLLRRGRPVALIFLAWPAASQAAKTDVIVLLNGDRITGEVMGMSRGKLDYKTDDAGRMAVEWIKLAHVTSPNLFEVEMASGTKYLGRLAATAVNGALVVEDARPETLAIVSVVGVSKLDAGLFQRMRAYIDLGFTFAKANEATTLTMAGEAAYRGSKFGSALSFNSYAQGQESTATASQGSVELQVTRFLPRRWGIILLGRAEQNDELNLDLRVTGGAAASRVLHQSNQSEVAAGAGLVVTRERYSPTEEGTGVGDDTQTNLEVQLGAAWDAFRYDSPTLDLSTTLNVYPSLSDAGRFRGDFTTRLKYEVFSDFDVGVTFTDTFDSRPPEEDASHNDFIASFTIGWSYRR
jgi:hypothetical protein